MSNTTYQSPANSSNFNGTERSLRESDGIQGQGQEIVKLGTPSKEPSEQEGKGKTNEAEGSNKEATTQGEDAVASEPVGSRNVDSIMDNDNSFVHMNIKKGDLSDNQNSIKRNKNSFGSR